MSLKRALTYVEIDIDFCANTYGTLPCTAAVGVTGEAKCFNTLKTCQDRLNFLNDPVTLRFAHDTGYLPVDIECVPLMVEVSFTPATVSLGKDLGQRASVSISFKDAPHSDTGQGFDPYRAERGGDAFRRGTFWGKFRARQPFLKGRPMRLIRGYAGQSLAEMETRHYILDSFQGPTPAGQFVLTAKDVLKLADADRAQAPLVSNGFLVAGIDDSVTSATLSPAGIGDTEYPASGYLAIGGKEIVSFTRSGDVLTIARGQLGAAAAAHEAQDRVQVVLRYVGMDPADIVYDLLTNYAAVNPDYISLVDWTNETTSFLQRLYTANIADPTDVQLLVSEIIEQAALAIWWDDQAQLVRLKVLRGIDTSAQLYDMSNTLEGTLQVGEQPDQRVSQVWTYYGLRNPLRPVGEPDNYRSTLATVNLQAETDEGQAAIMKIMSRWIPAFGRDTAERLNNIQLGRFQVPPRQVAWEVMRETTGIEPALGSGCQVAGWSIQDALGDPAIIPVQITSVNPMAEKFVIQGEEMRFANLDPADLINRTIIIDSNIENFNLRSVHDSIYPDPTGSESPSVTVTCIIESGVVVGSADASLVSFDVGSWPTGVIIALQVLGEIRGAGGDGGDSVHSVENGFFDENGDNGDNGGTALYTRYDITLEDAGSLIYGGGGGGGGGGFSHGGGGGGAGQNPGAGGSSDQSGEDGNAGTLSTGGYGGRYKGGGRFGGSGGTPGVAGGNGGFSIFGGSGGAAGISIDGISFITQDGAPGSRLGPQVN